ncbi:MAG: T9SS type A sorting domain-containing protein [Bacteroidia bacterium]
MKTIVSNQILKSITVLLILPFGFVCSLSAQEKTNDNKEGEVKIKIITSVNGDTKVVEKTFQPGDAYMLEELNDSFPELKAMAKVFSDSPSVFSYNYSFDIDEEMEKLGEEMEKMGEDFEFKWNSEDFEKEMEKLGKDFKFEWNTEEFEKEMENLKQELSKTIVIDGDEIRELKGNDENVSISENGDTIKISVRKEISVGDDITAVNKGDKKVKVIVIEEESDGKEGTESEIKVIKKVIRTNEKSRSTGMDEASETQALHVYPNPTSGKVTVNFKPDSKKKTQLKITDESGKVVYSEEIKTSSEFTHEIDLGNEAKGIYFVELVQGKVKYVNRIVLK